MSTSLPMSGNPILDEIMQAHASLSPAAQKAVGLASAGGAPPPAAPVPLAKPINGQPLGANSAPPQLNSLRQPTPDQPLAPAPMPTGPMQPPASPQGLKVGAPRGTVEGDQAYRTSVLNKPAPLENVYHDITNSGFGLKHPILSKVLGGLAQIPSTALDIGLSQGLPRIGSMVPGTTANRGVKIAGANKEITQEQGEREKTAQIGAQQAEAGLHTAQAGAAELTPATAEEAKAFGVPEGTMMNAATRGALAKQAGINTTKINTTTQTNQTKQDIAAANNLTKEDIAKLKPPQRDDRAIALMEKPAEQRTQEENAYLGAYAKWVQQTKVAPGVARAQAMGQFRPLQVVDPTTGDVHYEYSGNAIARGGAAPSSRNFKTAIAMAHYMTSGKGGSTLTAYRTAYDHLDLLQTASDALQNGDVQALNRLNNTFKEQFGSSAPTNFNAVKTMLSGEIANVAKASGATDAEIQAAKDELDRAQSPEQIKGIIDTNQDLMDQKAKEMMIQNEAGMQGQPAFGHGNQPASGGGMMRARDPQGVLHEAPKGTALPKGWKAE